MFEIAKIHVDCERDIKDLNMVLCFDYEIYLYDKHIFSITTLIGTDDFKYLRKLYDNHKKFNLIVADENNDNIIHFNGCEFICRTGTFISEEPVEVLFIGECEEYIESF